MCNLHLKLAIKWLNNIWNEMHPNTSFSGLAGLVVGHPCDTMKTITQNSKFGEMPASKLIQQMRQLGTGAFFRGLSVPLWSYAVVNSVFFGAHKYFTKELGMDLDAKNPEEHFFFRLPPNQYLQLTICGATAGLCQAFPAVPVEVIKVRMQKDAHLGKDMFICFYILISLHALNNRMHTLYK